MRRTDVCHPIESRAPAPRSFPAPCAPCGAWTPHGVFGSEEWCTGGPGVSRRPRPLRRVVARHMYCAPFCVSAWSAAARAFSSRGAVCDRASDTPVANHMSLPPLSPSRELRRDRASLPFTRIGAGRKTEGPPRPPSCAPREKGALETIRDAFHRQGLFVGSGGPYNPGPATASPLWTMVPPLNGGLPPLRA
jgi:hypothetical protein